MRLAKPSLVVVLKIAGYLAFFLGSLFFWLYLTFPVGPWLSRLAHELELKSQGRWHISLNKANFYRFSGVVVSDLRLTYTEADKPPLVFQLDKLTARLAIVPFLRGQKQLHLYGRVDTGDIRIDAQLSKEKDASIEIALQNFNLSSQKGLLQSAGMPLSGKITGRLAMSLPEGLDNLQKITQADSDLQINEFNMGPGQVAGLSLPNMVFGKISLKTQGKDGQLKIVEFKQEGGTFSIKATGQVNLQPRFEQSRLNVCLKIKADSAFLGRYPKLQSMIQLAELQTGKDTDGFLHLPLAGSLGLPELQRGLCRP